MIAIISILSDQLIPNLLFIKQMAGAKENHVFLTTKEMEEKQKSEILANALKLEKNQYRKVVIDAENPKLISEQLEKEKWDDNSDFIINITGGTKMMSQMVFQYFSKLPNTEIFYWPIGSSKLEQLHPAIAEKSFSKIFELNLESYLAVQGYSYKAKNSLSYSIKRADTLFQGVVKKGNSSLVAEIKNAQDENYYRADRNYLTGGWFEEWLYQTLKDGLTLSNSQIAFNLKLKSKFSLRESESDNEIDLAFVYKNVLYIFECKVFSVKQPGKKIIEAIYKISSIRQSMGLKATAIVAILTPFGRSQDRLKTVEYLSKMTQVRRVFSLEDMRDRKRFIQEIKTIINFS